MRVAIVHNAVDDGGAPDERDVLAQADAIRAALEALGHDPAFLPCTLDLCDFKHRLARLRPDRVFNIVESLNGTGRLIHAVPSLLDALAVPYTGAGAEAMFLSSHKILAKHCLAAAGLPTPAWVGPYPGGGPAPPPGATARDESTEGPWIVKSVWEHASIGLEEDRLALCQSAESAADQLPQRAAHLGGACFAERYIEGREFNLSLIASPAGPQVLAPAEILFEGFAENRLRIVGYRAKWDAGSFEFNHTPRRFDFPPEAAGLLAELRTLALQCWCLFGLNGYARVDFRVDAGGRPWILEVNANPCLSPDAGFAAALEASGIPFAHAVERILADARRRTP
ncbi:MAG: D-alanine--D-alanine ligase [Desulfobacterales bacterium]|jgi:D-alanine-D-alanine ligase|nr:D-alanine--D-alanine ligase [Desulfobacterales bacterium]